MANYQLLKADIDKKVYQNGHQEITGANLNSVLNAMVLTLGAEYQFAGVATIGTKPGSPDAKVFYIANGKGTYTNFGGLKVTEDEVVVLYWDSSWHKVSTGIASQAKLTELEKEVIYDVTANNSGATFASLSALLSSENLSTLIPYEVRCGGMTIRFVQSSDNKYVQYRLMSETFNTTVSNWQGVDDEPTTGSDNLVNSDGVNAAIAYHEEINYSSISKQSWIIRSSNNTYHDDSGTMRICYIPILPNTKLIISNVESSAYTFLTSIENYHTEGATPLFATGYNEVKALTTNSTTSVVAPSNANYLYLQVRNSGETTYSTINLYKETSIKDRIENIQNEMDSNLEETNDNIGYYPLKDYYLNYQNNNWVAGAKQHYMIPLSANRPQKIYVEHGVPTSYRLMYAFIKSYDISTNSTVFGTGESGVKVNGSSKLTIWDYQIPADANYLYIDNHYEQPVTIEIDGYKLLVGGVVNNYANFESNLKKLNSAICADDVIENERVLEPTVVDFSFLKNGIFDTSHNSNEYAVSGLTKKYIVIYSNGKDTTNITFTNTRLNASMSSTEVSNAIVDNMRAVKIKKGESRVFEIPNNAVYFYCNTAAGGFDHVSECDLVKLGIVRRTNNLFDYNLAHNNEVIKYNPNQSDHGKFVANNSYWNTGYIEVDKGICDKVILNRGCWIAALYDDNYATLDVITDTDTTRCAFSIGNAKYISICFQKGSNFDFVEAITSLVVNYNNSSDVLSTYSAINSKRLSYKDEQYFTIDNFIGFSSNKPINQYTESFSVMVAEKGNQGYKNMIVSAMAMFVNNVDDAVPTIRFRYVHVNAGGSTYNYIPYTSTEYVIGKKDYSEEKQWRLPPFMKNTRLEVTVTIPANVTLYIYDIHNTFSDTINRNIPAFRFDWHIDERMENLMLASKLGMPATITIPKKTSDGVWVCFHDDANVGAVLTEADGTPLTEPEYSASIEDFTYARIMQLRYKQTYDGTRDKVILLDEYFRVCGKCGIKPMLSLHPQPDYNECLEIKELAEKNGVLSSLGLKPQNNSAELAEIFRAFGYDIDTYIIQTSSAASGMVDMVESVGIDKTKVRLGFEYDGNTQASWEENVTFAVSHGYIISLVAYASFTGKMFDYWINKGVREFTVTNNTSYGLNW